MFESLKFKISFQSLPEGDSMATRKQEAVETLALPSQVRKALSRQGDPAQRLSTVKGLLIKVPRLLLVSFY